MAVCVGHCTEGTAHPAHHTAPRTLYSEPGQENETWFAFADCFFIHF